MVWFWAIAVVLTVAYADPSFRTRIKTGLFLLMAITRGPISNMQTKLAELGATESKVERSETFRMPRSWEAIPHLASYVYFSVRNRILAYWGVGRMVVTPTQAKVPYLEGTARYKILIPVKRGPCPWIDAFHDGINVTERVRLYAGPYHNFHGIPTTPKMLSYRELSFLMLDDSIRVFHEFDPIVFCC